jgi:2-polyprenyl-3-methyl-5-hydroxy-6-metoxy-1,4-benzoquinol methylase
VSCTSQQRLADFSEAALRDRHERQHSLLAATGTLPPPPYRVLDLGGGSGVTAVWAARKGWPTTIVDLDPDNLRVLERHLAEHEPGLPFDVVVGDSATADVQPDAYDIVYQKDLLEHVVDVPGTLATAVRALKPGGLLYVATTNVICPIQLEYQGVGPYSWYPQSLKDRIRELAMTRRPEIVNHTPYPALHWFSRGSLRQAMVRAGLAETWDIYDLIESPQDLTRRTRVLYPLVRAARNVRPLRWIVDMGLVGLTMVARKPVAMP